MLHYKYIILIVLLRVSRGQLESDIEDPSLKQFEERIDRLRRSSRNGGDEVIDDDEDVPDVGSGDKPTPPEKRNFGVNDVNIKDSKCCKTGMSMAALGFDCSNNDLIYMSPKQKLHALRDILSDLDIQINNETRSTIYTPFRRCLLKETRHLLKCCSIVSRQNKIRHSNKDIGSRIRYPSYGKPVGFNRRFDNSLNRYRSGGRCKNGRCDQTPFRYTNGRRTSTRRRA